MTIFAIMGTARLNELEASIGEHYSGQFCKLGDAQWFVYDKITSREVSDKLGITTAHGGEGVVMAVTSYWGHTTRQLWEWLSSREGIPSD